MADATEYVTLAEAAAWLGLENGDQDNDLRVAIAAASAVITTHCNADLGLLEASEVLFGLGTELVFPKRGPLVSVASCLDENGRSVPVRISREAIKRTDGGMFYRGDEFTLTYTAGLATIPEDVKLAAKITVAGLMTAAAYDPNLANESLGGVIAGSYANAGPGSLPPPAISLLARFVRVVPF